VEIIVMLIAPPTLDPEQFELEILRYRKMTARNIVLDQPTPAIEPLDVLPNEIVISIEQRGAGRPVRSCETD
jgi:hypothetical protein